MEKSIDKEYKDALCKAEFDDHQLHYYVDDDDGDKADDEKSDFISKDAPRG